jgi:hypothetical protein
VSEDLGGEIEDGKWARNTSRSASRDDSQIPTHNHRHESKTTGNLKVVVRVVKSCRSWIEAELVVCGSEEGEQEDEGEEYEDEWDIGAKRPAEEAEADESHDDVVVSLSCVVCLRECTRNITFSVGCGESNCWVTDVSKIDPMAAEDDEDAHGKGVSENELEDTCDVHRDPSDEQETSAECIDGASTGTWEESHFSITLNLYLVGLLSYLGSSRRRR